MSVTEAKATNTLLRYLLGEHRPGVQAPTNSHARDAAAILADSAHARLMAGMRADDVHEAWPHLILPPLADRNEVFG